MAKAQGTSNEKSTAKLSRSNAASANKKVAVQTTAKTTAKPTTKTTAKTTAKPASKSTPAATTKAPSAKAPAKKAPATKATATRSSAPKTTGAKDSSAKPARAKAPTKKAAPKRTATTKTAEAAADAGTSPTKRSTTRKSGITGSLKHKERVIAPGPLPAHATRGIQDPNHVQTPEEKVAAQFNDKNIILFTKRRDILKELAVIEAKDQTKLKNTDKGKLRRLRHELEEITSEIVMQNYGLVRSYVRRFTSNTSREDSQDFERAGAVGLMRAVASYDVDKGRFGQWAFKPIQREVLRAVRDADHPNMNPGDFEKRADILRAVTKLQKEHGEGYRPTHIEVAEVSGATIEQVGRVLNAPRLDSLSTPVGDEAGSTLGDFIEDIDDNLEDSVLSKLSITALEEYGLTCLDERELFVVIRRFGLDAEPRQRLSAIGETLGLSREAVRQVESKALSKMAHPTVLRRLVRSGRP